MNLLYNNRSSLTRAWAILWIMILGVASPALVSAESDKGDNSMLTLQRIFDSDEFQEEKLGLFRWSKQSSSYFSLVPAGSDQAGFDLIKTDPASGASQTVVTAKTFIPSEESQPLKIDDFEFSAEESKLLIYTNSKRIWRYKTRGDYWVLDIATGELKKLGADAAASTLKFAKFSSDGSHVAYVRENKLYVQNLDDMQIKCLTPQTTAKQISGTSDWVNEEELGIRDAYRWSPDGQRIAFWQFDTTDVEQFHLIDNTQDTYPRITSFPYPKVGKRNSATRLGIVHNEGGRILWLDVPGDPREHYIPHMEWSPDGTQLLIQQFNRLQNKNRVMLADAKTGQVRSIHTETDTAWLDNINPVRWINNGRGLVWLSEKNGWRNAYLLSIESKQLTPITQGKFDVIDIEAIDESNGWLYFAASPEDASQRYLYRTKLDGKTEPQRLSPENQPGWHTDDISPDANWSVHTYSTFMNPPVVDLIQLPDHQVKKELVDNQKLRTQLAKLQQPSLEFLKVDIGDDITLDAWCLKPPKIDPNGKYPVLFHVYGEPAGQSVRDVWQRQRGLWHWMLAQQGIMVISIDNRGTLAPRGREWRKSVHRKIGIIAPEEQAAATRALLKRFPFADSSRVGIWGWSGGGSMSLNALFRYPDLYHTAVAVAPNPNQLLYDTIYQERYMGLPEDNKEGYRFGSPITYASQLQGNLLLIHGTGDDNGHFQGTEMLMNELIAHNKQFTIMPYPARSHAISEGTNTKQHFYRLMTNYLLQHLGNSKE